MRIAIKNTLIIACLAAAAVAHADGGDVSYDFIDVRYVDSDIAGIDLNGFRVEASSNISGNWLLVWAFDRRSFDFDPLDVDVDLTSFEVGGGYVWPQAADCDFFATASFISSKVDTDFGDDDGTGFGVTAGIRSRFIDNFEGRAELRYTDVGDGDTVARLSGDYYFSDELSVGVSIDLGGDSDSIYLGGRWMFGQRKL